MKENTIDDLIPLIFFLIIVGVNALKFIIGKGGKAKRAPAKPGAPPRKRTPSSIEQFFERLAEQLEPPAREVPGWPEGIERPNYIEEMDEFERAAPEKPVATPSFLNRSQPKPAPSTMEFEPLEKPAIAPMPRQATQAILSGSQGMRIPCMNSLKPAGAAGRATFRIKGKTDLQKALLGHIVFSPPRAFDPSFDDTISKR